MSLKLGGTKTTNSQSTSATNSLTTPVVPQWASDLVQSAAGQVGDLLKLDPNSLVAGAHPLQQQAAAGAAGLTGLPWNFDSAADLTRGAADTSWLNAYTSGDGGARASAYVNDYLNPYLKDVVDASSADFDANAGQVRAQQALDLAGSGAFGGSGAALTQSMTEGELARARASTLSGLRSHAYDTALSAAAGDADRALQDRAQRVGWGFQGQQQQLAAASQLANLSSQFDANQRANIAAQAGMGDTLRDIQNQQLQAPIVHAQQVQALLAGLPINIFTGQQTSSTTNESGVSQQKDNPGLLERAQTAAQIAMAMG